MAAQKQRLTRTFRTYTKSQKEVFGIKMICRNWERRKKQTEKTEKKREFNGFFQIEITMPGGLGKAYINN